MTVEKDRRAFFRQGVADALREVVRGQKAMAEELERPRQTRPVPGTQLRPWAEHASALCSLEELRGLARIHGLAAHVDAMVALAAVSYRLLPLSTGQSRVVNTTAKKDEHAVRAALDLTSLAPLGLTDVGGATGMLLVESELREADGATSATARMYEPTKDTRSTICGLPVSGSSELVLPRTWSPPVEALGLEPAEQAAWTEVRTALAEKQSVRPVDGSSQTHRLHRLLGVPDERSGTLAFICELFDRGAAHDEIDLTGPDRAELERDAANWRMLLQIADVTADREAMVTMWCRRDRLARGDLRRLVAVRRSI